VLALVRYINLTEKSNLGRS